MSEVPAHLFVGTKGDVFVAQNREVQKYMTHTPVARAACGCEYIRQDYSGIILLWHTCQELTGVESLRCDCKPLAESGRGSRTVRHECQYLLGYTTRVQPKK